MNNKKVIVGGAGCAGRSVTYTLRKQGGDVVCFEAKDVAGGRCRSVPEEGYDFFVGTGCTEPQGESSQIRRPKIDVWLAENGRVCL